MKNSTIILLSVASFFIFGVVGYFVTGLFANTAREKEMTQEDMVTPSQAGQQTSEAFDTITVKDSIVPKDTLVVVDEVKPQIVKVNKLSKSEFQEILNSGDENRGVVGHLKDRISSRCRFSFSGINEDEPTPASYNDILMRINMGTWTSVSVLSASYDEADRMVSARIQVNY